MLLCRNPFASCQNLSSRLLSQFCTRKYHHPQKITSEELIRKHTEISRDHLTPEIALHLITPKCPLWNSAGENSLFVDPYWAFYWPGGQVLSRYVLDNKSLFRNKIVTDIGSGCGASAIASKLAGAATVTANDIDRVSLSAINMNAAQNGVSLNISQDNLIGCLDVNMDILLLGDMFYDEAFVSEISEWVTKLSERGVTIFVGDPGRLPLLLHPLRHRLRKVAHSPLPDNCLKENNGMTVGYVWEYLNCN